MSFDHLKQCTHCGKKIRPKDVQYQCDACGQVYCADCKHKYLVLSKGKGNFTRLICPRCADLNGSQIIHPTIIN